MIYSSACAPSLLIVVRATREIEMIAYFAARGGTAKEGDEPEEQSDSLGGREGTKHKEGVRHFSGLQCDPNKRLALNNLHQYAETYPKFSMPS